jgi:hypothetical protein
MALNNLSPDPDLEYQREAYRLTCQASDAAFTRYNALPADVADEAFGACEDAARLVDESWKELTAEYPAVLDDLAAEAADTDEADDVDCL